MERSPPNDERAPTVRGFAGVVNVLFQISVSSASGIPSASPVLIQAPGRFRAVVFCTLMKSVANAAGCKSAVAETARMAALPARAFLARMGQSTRTTGKRDEEEFIRGEN